MKKLWNQLPDDDLVVDFDPFIDAQDFDHISVADIEVTNLQEKRADAKVTVDIGFTEPSIIVFKMVKELDEVMHRMHKPSVNYPIPEDNQKPVVKSRKKKK